jgi:hypothetical protein
MTQSGKTTTPLTLIAKMLKDIEIIDDRFNGQLIFHFCDGGIAEIDKLEKKVEKKLKSV